MYDIPLVYMTARGDEESLGNAPLHMCMCEVEGETDNNCMHTIMRLQLL